MWMHVLSGRPIPRAEHYAVCTYRICTATPTTAATPASPMTRKPPRKPSRFGPHSTAIRLYLAFSVSVCCLQIHGASARESCTWSSACRRHHRPSGPRHPSLDRHYSSLTHLHGVGTYARSLTERYSVTACYHVSSHQGLPPGLAVNYLRRPAPQQKPAWTKRSQRRRAVRRGSRWLHASKARGVRGDPGCATIEMGSIGRSTAAVRPFRLASAAALARPPTSPPQLTAPKARQLLQVCTPMARGCWQYRADGRHPLGPLVCPCS